LKEYVNEEFGLNIAKITGSSNKNNLGLKNDFNGLLGHFSPISKERSIESGKEIDILIGTDCISEGQNLQDCDFMINYDIHWNPVRIIQRYGRVDRIGSRNEVIQMVNFWPAEDLESYIKLKYKIENKSSIVELTGVVEQDLRKLEKLKNKILEIEELDDGISLTDISLNDFRIDLSSYIEKNGTGELDNTPLGIHTSVISNELKEVPQGVIFLLKLVNLTKKRIEDNIHPYYLIYLDNNGEVILKHINVKRILDTLRKLARVEKNPIKDAYEKFNQETNDGENMDKFSTLLTEAIKSIIEVNADSEIESIFEEGGTRINSKNMKELSDFELVSFFSIYD